MYPEIVTHRNRLEDSGDFGFGRLSLHEDQELCDADDLVIEEPRQDLLKPRGGARLHAHLGARALVGGKGPVVEVGEGGDGGAGEDVGAVGRGEGYPGGLGHAGEGVWGPARGGVIDAAAAPLEHEGRRGEREREDREEHEKAAPRGAAAGGRLRRRHRETPICRARLMWWRFRSAPFGHTFSLGPLYFRFSFVLATIYNINGHIFS